MCWIDEIFQRRLEYCALLCLWEKQEKLDRGEEYPGAIVADDDISVVHVQLMLSVAAAIAVFAGFIYRISSNRSASNCSKEWRAFFVIVMPNDVVASFTFLYFGPGAQSLKLSLYGLIKALRPALNSFQGPARKGAVS